MKKITIELSDDLAAKALQYAVRRGTTLQALIEKSLHRTVRDESDALPFRLRDGHVHGDGLQAPFADWQAIRRAAYGDSTPQ